MRHEAIYLLYPNVVRIEGDFSAFNAAGDKVELDNSAVDSKTAELKAAYDAAEYQRNRAAAYPSIQEQLDMQYWDSVNGTTTWADAIAAVKVAHPKGA